MLSSSTTTAQFLTIIGNSLHAVSMTTWVLVVCAFLLVVVFSLAALAASSTSGTRVEPAGPRLPGPTGFASTKLLLGMLKGAPKSEFHLFLLCFSRFASFFFFFFFFFFLGGGGLSVCHQPNSPKPLKITVILLLTHRKIVHTL